MPQEIEDLFKILMSPQTAEAYCKCGLEMDRHGINASHYPVEDKTDGLLRSDV